MDRPAALDDLPPEPWRNGRGVTRTVAADAAAGTDWRWRVSVADLSGSAPFSRFAGVDRSAVLVYGTGLELAVDGNSQVLGRLGQQVDFGGESDVQAATPSGPVRLWNVMTRRGTLRSRVQWLQDASELPPADVRLLLAVDADCTVMAGPLAVTLRSGEYWMPPGGRQLLALPGPGGGLLFTRIDG